MFDRVRTFFAQRKRSLAVFGGLVVLLTLLTAPSVVIHTYNQVLENGEPWNMAFGRAVVMFFALALLWFVHGAMLFAMWSYFVPKFMADARGIKNGIGAAARSLPPAWRATRERISRVPSGLRSARAWCGRTSGRITAGIGTAFAAIASVPSRWRAMSSGDKFAAVMTFFSLLMLAGIGYLNWGLATTLHAKLPEWLQSSRPFMGILYIDAFMSMFMWAFIFPIVTTLIRVIVRRNRK